MGFIYDILHIQQFMMSWSWLKLEHYLMALHLLLLFLCIWHLLLHHFVLWFPSAFAAYLLLPVNFFDFIIFLLLVSHFFFSTQISPFSTSCKAGLVVVNSFKMSIYEALYFSFSYEWQPYWVFLVGGFSLLVLWICHVTLFCPVVFLLKK